MRARTLAVLMVVTLSCLTAQAQDSPSVASEEGRVLLERLQDLDQDLQRQLRRGQLAGEARQDLPEKLPELARQYRESLQHLQQLAGSLPSGEQPLLLAKIEQLQRLANKLHRVAATGDATMAMPASAMRATGPHRPIMEAGRAVPVNDTCSTATPVSDGSWVGSTAEAGNDGHAPCGASFSSPDVWFRYTAASSGLLGANTFGSSYDTVLSVHSSCPGTLASTIACDDDTFGLQSAVSFEAEAGIDYLIRVSGFDGAAGTFVLSVGPAGSITGTVGKAGNLRPVVGATVNVFDQDGGYSGTATTDEAGAYQVDGLSAGTYFARAWSSGNYIGVLYDGLPCPGGCDPTSGTEIPVSLGTVTTGISFGLPTGGSISGTVSETGTGAPVAGATVTVYDSEGMERSSATSNVAGLYSAGGLPTGSYTVVASHAAHARQLYDGLPCPGGTSGCDPTDGTPVAVTVGSATAGIDFSLARVGSISGRITEAGTGEALAGAQVEVWASGGESLKSVNTDELGNYFVGGLDTGSYVVKAYSFEHVDELYDGVPCEQGCDLAAATPVDVVDGATTTGIDLALERMGEISGSVTASDTGGAVPFISVILYSNGEEVDSAYVGADGLYSVPVLDSGYYTAYTGDLTIWWIPFLHEYIDEMYDDISCDLGCYPEDGTLIPVTSGAATTGIDFVLDRRGTLSGTVTDAATGEPISGIRVEIRSTSGYLHGSDTTDAQGRYQSSVLVAGSYLVLTSSRGSYVDMIYDGVPCPGGPWVGCSPASGTLVQVENGVETTGIDLALEPATTGIAGMVRNAVSGAALPGLRIQIYDETGDQVHTMWTDTFGLYAYYGLPTGTYFVIAESYELVDEIYDNIPCEWCGYTSGTPVVVEADTVTRHIDFSLEPGGAIAGSLSDAATGEPVAGTITVHSLDGTDRFYSTSGSDGSYLVEGVPRGSYLLSFTGGLLPFLPEVYDDVPCPAGQSGCLDLATPVEVRSGETTSSIDADLALLGSGIRVTVRDHSGEAVSGVYIDVWDAGSGELVTTALSGVAGTGMAVVPAGTYYVSTHNTSGFVDQVYGGWQCPAGSAFSGACDVTAGEQVVVLEDQVTTGIELVLGTPLFSNGFESGDASAWSAVIGESEVIDVLQDIGYVTGTVRDRTSGEPIPDVPVRLYDSTGALFETTNTSINGVYGTYLLPAGTYTAVAGGGPCPDLGCSWIGRVYNDIACNPQCLWPDGTPIQVVAGAITEGIDFALDQRGSIAGTVSESATGDPLEDIRVEIWRFGDNESVAHTSTDHLGRYQVWGLDPGDYYVVTNERRSPLIDELYDDLPCFRGPNRGCTATTGTPVHVELNTVTDGIDLALDEGGTISGTISDALSAEPLADASVAVYGSDGLWIGYATTDSSGSWSLAGLGSGTYFAAINHCDAHARMRYDGVPCAPNRYCDPRDGTPIPVTSTEITSGIDFALPPYGSFSGVVRDTVNGSPVPAASIRVYSDQGSFQLITTTAQDGLYSASLPPGSYYATAMADRYACQRYDGLPGCHTTDITSGTPIVVEPGETLRSVNFLLQSLQKGTIEGTVTDDRTGQPLANVSLRLWDENGDQAGRDSTGELGSFRLTGLEAGTYYLATEYTSAYLDELYDDLPTEQIEDPTKGTPVVASEDSTVRADFALHFIDSGIVATAHHADSGAPLAGVLIDVWDAGTGELVATTATAVSGAALAAVPAGTYYLSTDNDRGLLNQVYEGVLCPDGPAFIGACDPTSGTPVVVNDEQVTEGIAFLIGPAVIFSDGFESGDAARWSAVTP